MKYPKTKDEARDQAIEWQRNFSNGSMSWGELIDAGNYFVEIAKKFKLTEEFKENGIIGKE